MGYYTEFFGEIRVTDKRAIATLKRMVDAQRVPFDCLGNSECDSANGELSIDERWKNYDNDMERICLFVVRLDCTAEGTIRCEGDDWDDSWMIVIADGKVEVRAGRLEYDRGERFTDSRIERMAVNTKG